jgi:hypothetical protein
MFIYQFVQFGFNIKNYRRSSDSFNMSWTVKMGEAEFKICKSNIGLDEQSDRNQIVA